MVFKLAMMASERWNLLSGSKLIEKVVAGVEFKDGVMLKDSAA